MRKEAPKDLWNMLYNLADELKALRPWEDLWDVDLIGIQENGRQEPVFVSVMGRREDGQGGTKANPDSADGCGIAIYDGTRGLGDFQMTGLAPQNMIPDDYAMLEQHALMLYWGERMEVPQDQQDMIKELDRKYYGKGNWPFFLSFAPRFAPWTPDEKEVRLLIETFVQLIEAVNALREGRARVDFEKGEFCFRYFDIDQMNWMTAPAKVPFIDMEYDMLEITDEAFLAELLAAGQRASTLMLDFGYLHGELVKEEYDRPLNPLLFLAVDGGEGRVLKAKVVNPEERESDTAAEFLLDYIEKEGRPQLILARNPHILAALQDICRQLSIDIQRHPLTEMDGLLEDMRRQMAGGEMQ